MLAYRYNFTVNECNIFIGISIRCSKFSSSDFAQVEGSLIEKESGHEKIMGWSNGGKMHCQVLSLYTHWSVIDRRHQNQLL